MVSVLDNVFKNNTSLVILFDAFIPNVSSQGLALKNNVENTLSWRTSRNHKATGVVPS